MAPPVSSPRSEATARGRPASKLSWRSCVRVAGRAPAHGEPRSFRQRRSEVEPRHHAEHLQGNDGAAAPSSRGPGHGSRAALPDHPFDGSGKAVVGGAVLVGEGVGDGAPGPVLGEQGGPAHALGDPAELDQDRVGGLDHDRRHGRQEVVDHGDEPHLKIGEFPVGELGPQVQRHPLGHGTHRVDGHDGRQIPGLQLPARPQDGGSGFRSHRWRIVILSTGPQAEEQQEQCSTNEHGLPPFAPKGAWWIPRGEPSMGWTARLSEN